MTGRLFRRVNDGLEGAALAIVIALMAAMCAVTFAQALGRYALHFSLTWSEEASRYMMVWVSMLGGAVAARRRMHVGFDGFVALLPSGLRRGARVVAVLIAIAIFGSMAWYGTRLARFNMLQRSAALEWPMGIPYAAIPVGAALLTLFLVEELGRTVTRADGSR